MNKSKELATRLARIEGQIAGLRRSIESGSTDCTKTLIQAKAASQALKRFCEAYSREYAQQCLDDKRSDADIAEKLDEIISAAYSLS